LEEQRVALEGREVDAQRTLRSAQEDVRAAKARAAEEERRVTRMAEEIESAQRQWKHAHAAAQAELQAERASVERKAKESQRTLSECETRSIAMDEVCFICVLWCRLC
jgi:chromosome segregation ATPase